MIIRILFFLMVVFGSALLSAQSIGAAEKQHQESTMRNCMETIDASQMERLSKQVELFDSEITILCQAGDRKQANAKADLFAQQMLADSSIQQLLTCGQKLSERIPGMITERMDFLQAGGQSENRVSDICGKPRQDNRKPRQWTVWP